jgi:hypothetical protein
MFIELTTLNLGSTKDTWKITISSNHIISFEPVTRNCKVSSEDGVSGKITGTLIIYSGHETGDIFVTDDYNYIRKTLGLSGD